MAAVNVYEAKTHLSRLLRRVRGGEEIVIAAAGRPIARLVPIGTSAIARVSEPRRLPRAPVAGRGARLVRFLEREVWPKLPPSAAPLTREERERILGYGPEGV